MKYVIWGAGERGRRLPFHLGRENVYAYVDTNPKLQGKFVDGIEVISAENLMKIYKDKCIVVSTHEEEIVPWLHEKNINNFYELSKCPEDFLSAYPRKELKNHILSHLDETKGYVIYGNSLFSILLFSWIYEANKLKNCSLIMGNDCCEEIMTQIKLAWGECVKESFDAIPYVIHHILVTTQEEETYGIPEAWEQRATNIYRYSEKYGVYQKPQLKKYKGTHNGQRCFIVATGPSLRREDLETLHRNSELCFGVNTIYRIFDQTVWRPDYYVSADYRVVEEEEFSLDYLNGITCFIADNNEAFNQQQRGKNIHLFHSGQVSTKRKNLPFSENAANVIYACGTVCYSAIQLAVYMGFKELYLLGADSTGINSNYKVYGHFHEEKELTAICFGPQMQLCYETAKEYAEKHGIKIYNATRGGELEVFERVDFDKLFDE